MHSMGIVHRDLKPENILVDEWTEQARTVKIADFGISAMIDGSIEDENAENNNMRTRVGTLSYTAPEILGRKPYDHRVDYWSLGIIMHILCAGYPVQYTLHCPLYTYSLSLSLLCCICLWTE